jgi:hypothetical protein
LSALIRIGLFVFLLASCKSNETSIATLKSGAEYFSPEEVIAATNALTAIIDWPEDTIEHQKNLIVDPESAKTLILPLHPLWDEKVAEVASQIPKWDQSKISNVRTNCLKKCECDFYQEVLDRNPGLNQKSFAGLKIQKTKADVLNCLKNMPSLQKIRAYLEKERKDYETKVTQ